jgi:histone-lysine N-methyltransferase SETMAR
MKKICARWVLLLLIADQKTDSREISEKCLEHFNKNETDFVRRFITMDGTWIQHYTPESTQPSKQWIEAGCSASKKTRSVPSAGKVMASVFWDAEGILFISYLEKCKTITGEYYSNHLTRLNKKKIMRKDPLCKRKNNPSSGQCTCPQNCFGNGKLGDLHYELLEHPRYSPDLAPSDFNIFPKHKLFYAGQSFSSNQEAIAAVEGYFANLTKNVYRDRIMALEHRWNKCTSLKEDYVEK